MVRGPGVASVLQFTQRGGIPQSSAQAGSPNGSRTSAGGGRRLIVMKCEKP
jgi:hypothetical protein